MINPNRAILLTPPGVAAIAVIRITGPATAEFLAKHFSRSIKSSRCIHGDLRDDAGDVIDDPVVVLSHDSSSADINLHGGDWVVRATLELLRGAGIEVLAQTTPLPELAVGADDPLEREMLQYLPLATTGLALRVLLSQPVAWKALEARRPVTADEIESTLNDRALHHLLHPPRVAIIGAANVGKSTLANQLFAQERSITADIPGTTRDWVGELANLDGLVVQLIDTPGIRETSDAIEEQAITQSRQQVQQADLIILVLDASRPLEPEQSLLLAAYPRAMIVVNKSDVAAQGESSFANAIATVATSGRGVDQLMRRIRESFGCEDIDFTRARCWTQRQRDLLLSRDVLNRHQDKHAQDQR